MPHLMQRLDDRARAVTERSGRLTLQAVKSLGGVFLAALVTGLLCYGIDVFNLSVSLDEEAQSTVRGGVIQWVHQDRWAMYLLNSFVLPTPTVPFLSVLIGVTGLALSAALLLEMWGGGHGARTWLAGATIVSTPVVVFLMHFNTTQYGAFLGLAIGLTGLRMYLAGGPLRLIAGWAMVVFAISVYQSIGMAVLCGYLVHAVNRQLREPTREGSLLAAAVRPVLFFVWLGSTVVGHKLTALLARRWAGDGGGYAIVDQAYTGSYWSSYSVGRVLSYLAEFLNGERWYLGWPAALLVYGGVFLVLTRLAYRERLTPGLALGIVLLVGAILSPFLLVIGTGATFWPSRTLLALPVLFGGIVYTALGTRSWLAAAPYWAVCVTCLGGFIVANNRMLYADQQQWILDRQLVFEIQHRLHAIGMDRGRVVRLAVVGSKRFDPSPGRFEEETVGMSFFSPRLPVANQNVRIGRLLQIFGDSRVFGVVSPDQYKVAIDAASEMPFWPNPGSVQMVGEVAVVKLSEPTPAQSHFATAETSR
jgi:hypothetical protein